MRSILLGVGAVLAAAACAIAFLALSESYSLFTKGGPVAATVVKTEAGKHHGYVIVSFMDGDKRVEQSVENASREEALALKPTDKVEILRHGNVPSRIALRVSVERDKPSWLLAGGALLLLALAVYLFLRPRLRRLRRARRTDPLDIVVDSIRDTRTTAFALSLFVLLPFAALILAVAIFDEQRPGVAGLVVLGVLFVLCALIGIWQLVRAVRMLDPRRSPEYRLITETPERIGWVYATVVTQSGIAASAYVTLQLWLTDGSHTHIAVDAADQDALIDEIAHRAPRAILGYTREAEAAYHAQVAAGKEAAA